MGFASCLQTPKIYITHELPFGAGRRWSSSHSLVKRSAWHEMYRSGRQVWNSGRQFGRGAQFPFPAESSSAFGSETLFQSGGSTPSKL
jgi:hypothetical protein